MQIANRSRGGKGAFAITHSTTATSGNPSAIVVERSFDACSAGCLFHNVPSHFQSRWLLFAALFSFLADASRGNGELQDGLRWPKPISGLAVFASAHGISLDRFSETGGGHAQLQDDAVILVSTGEGDGLKQWLVEIEMVDLSVEEKNRVQPEVPLYVSTGTKLVFRTRPLAVVIKTHGPFRAGSTTDEAKTRTARTIVNEENLALGFDQACRACIRIVALKRDRAETGNIGLAFRDSPFRSADQATARTVAREVGLTVEEERAMAGSVPALVSFFQIAQSADGLREVLDQIVDLPSAWSVLIRGGKLDAHILLDSQKIAPEVFLNPPANGFLLPVVLEINERPSLQCALYVIAPRPPFLLTAGIIGIVAQSPTKPQRRATLQLISATSHPETTRESK